MAAALLLLLLVVVAAAAASGVSAQRTQWHSLAGDAGEAEVVAVQEKPRKTQWHSLGHHANTNTVTVEAEAEVESEAVRASAQLAKPRTAWHSLATDVSTNTKQSNGDQRRRLEDGVSGAALEERGGDEPQIAGEPQGAAAVVQRKSIRDSFKESLNAVRDASFKKSFAAVRKAWRERSPVNQDEVADPDKRDKPTLLNELFDEVNELVDILGGAKVKDSRKQYNAKAFETFLRKEFSFENLAFLLAVRRYKKMASSGAVPNGVLEQEAKDIYATFLDMTKAELLVNLPNKFSKEEEVLFGSDKVPAPDQLDLAAIKKNFEGAESEILGLVSADSFRRFKFTAEYLTTSRAQAIKNAFGAYYRAAVAAQSSAPPRLLSSGLTTMMSPFANGLAGACMS